MSTLEELVEIMKVLRSPQGCPWDREQTHASLKPNMLEEAYEAVDAVNSDDMDNLCEELGDVLLQVLIHAQIASEAGDFDIEAVAKGLKDKLIRRHPHVFGSVNVNGSEQVMQNWEKIKQEEKTHRKSASWITGGSQPSTGLLAMGASHPPESAMDGISKSQSALMSAQKISKKAVKKGFEWPDEESLYKCIFSEFDEFKEAQTPQHAEEELGDILFAVVNLARWHKIDAEQALLKANRKFTTRFRKMEELAAQSGAKPLEEYSFAEYDALWNKAKEQT